MHFEREVFAGVGDLTASFETEQSIRDRHDNDPDQFDPFRRGRFRYAVLNAGGAASGTKFITRARPRTFAHELGHTLGMEHWGHDDWGFRGMECVPHYLSLMRYGEDGLMQLNELDGVGFNPAMASEVSPFGPGLNHAFLSGAPWNYTNPSPTASAVDLNRDGTHEVASATFRAPALTLTNSECISLAQGSQTLSTSSAVSGATDIVRIGTRLYSFWSSGSDIQYRFASLGAVGDKSCTGSPTPYDGPSCLSWGATVVLPMSTGAKSVSVHLHAGELVAAYQDAASHVVVRRYQVNSSGTLSHLQASSFGATVHERSDLPVELFSAHDGGSGTLSLLYLSQGSRFRQRTWNGTSWSALISPVSLPPLGAPPGTPNTLITGLHAPVVKTWPDEFAPGVPDTNRRTYAIFPNGAGQLRFFRLSQAPGVWQELRLFNEVTGAKPFLDFRHIRTGSGQLRNVSGAPNMGGHFVIGWSEPVGSGATTRARFMLSGYYHAGAPPTTSLNLSLARDYVGNSWSHDQPSTSMSLYSDATIDNVFGLLARQGDGVVFLPHADGSPDNDFVVHSDYRTMEDHVCNRLSFVSGIDCGGLNVLD